MKKISIFLVLLFGISCALFSQDFKPDASYYSIGFWEPDTLGNHRAVVKVTESNGAVSVTIPWRRHDADIESKTIIVIDGTTGKQIDNIFPVNLSNESGTIIFEPQTIPSEYYIYYMPYKTSGGPYPRISYTKGASKADDKWVTNVITRAIKTPEAKFVGFQALSEFDSFYPMEVIATKVEKESVINSNKDKNYLIFAENREYPIKMTGEIPYRWAVKGAGNTFFAEADQNEYFVYQLGVWAVNKDLTNIKVTFTDLKSKKNTISSSVMTCFNTEGKDWIQRPMKIKCDVAKGKIQALWMGVQMPVDVEMGVYKGKVTISADNEPSQTIDVVINLSDYVRQDKGDNDIYRLSRLRWLNSDMEVNTKLVKPFTPLVVNGKEISCLGRSVSLNEYGFPENISSYFTEEVTTIGKVATPAISSPIRFVIEQGKKEVKWSNNSFDMKKTDGIVKWESTNTAGDFTIKNSAKMEFDGFMEYMVTVKANKTTSVNDIRVEIPLNGEVAKYWLGMGQKGGLVPDKYNWKWDVTKAQEGFWIGNVNAGLHSVFRDEHYVRPLNTNFYQSKPLIIPECWNNGGKGGIMLKRNGKTMQVNTYSGARTIRQGEELTFIFLVSVTPFKPIDTEKQWADRYYHAYRPIDYIVSEGANTINIHHAQAINPFINYPFFRPDFMKAYIDEAHEKGCKVKIYYTVRELANRSPELWALRSLGHEVFSSGKAGGYSWLQEHLQDDYIGAWFVDKYKDAAIVNSGVSRWHNYYVEGLYWLVRSVGIDGIYIDDLAIDRNTMKRVRRALEQYTSEPRIDLHSANQFNQRDGFTNSACLYMEHMPYLDRLWFGEYFEYDLKPDYWMAEVAGIPFGMMGEMLENDGNPWRGMLYGMTARHHYHGQTKTLMPGRLWKVWDMFGIKGSRMIGYWVSYNPVKTSDKDIYATCFVKEGKTMIAIASWADKDVDVKLNINWKELGIDSAKANLYAPAIQDFQPEMRLKPTDTFKVEKGKGYILILE